MDRAEPFPLATDLSLAETAPVVAKVPSAAVGAASHSEVDKSVERHATSLVPSRKARSSAALTLPATRQALMAAEAAPKREPNRTARVPSTRRGSVWLIVGLALAGIVALSTLRSLDGTEQANAALEPELSHDVQAPASVGVPVQPLLSQRVGPPAAAPGPESRPLPPPGQPPPDGISPPRTVVLSVFPYEARVSQRGTAIPGPPYTVQIPADGRLTLEVSQPGYVTRRVTLDGGEPRVTIGLTRNPSYATDERRGESAKTKGAEPQPDGAVPVLSGL